MKFLKTIITAFFLLLMMNCTSYHSAFITEGNDASHRSYAHYQSVKQQNLDDTIFLVNGKKVKYEKFQKYDDLTSVNVITDEAEIERLGYDIADVKNIVVCERGK
jgi:hypothetical protein